MASACSRAAGSGWRTSIAAISSRSSGDTSMTRHCASVPVTTDGSAYSVRRKAASTTHTSCSMPGGIQIAREGGTTQAVSPACTRSTLLWLYATCAHGCVWRGNRVLASICRV